MSKIPLTGKLYVWSVVLEPLLFFVVWDEWVTGIGGNVSRLLQGVVIIALIFRYFINPTSFRIINVAHPFYRNYGIYLGVTVFAGLIGALFGAYNVSITFPSSLQSYFANLLNSPPVRPLFEYVIAIYYFVYFVVLPRYMLKTEGAVLYFFSVFKMMFIISFIVGVIDLALAFCDIRLIPCHISNWPQWAGQRFHGLAGEPRHAFVYLFLGLAVFNLEAHIKDRSLSRFWIVSVISAALLTQSASGLIGIAVFLVLFIMNRLTYAMKSQQLLLLSVILILITGLMYGNIISSEHLLQYLKSVPDLWNLLESGDVLPYFMAVQSNEIYPLYDLTVKARDLNILPIIIGSGLGSASAINNLYSPFAAGQMINPNSQLVRSLFESGIVGIFFFIRSFLYPVKKLTKHIASKNRLAFITLTLLLIGCFFGIRSAAPFIYLGILLAVFAPFSQTKKGQLYECL